MGVLPASANDALRSLYPSGVTESSALLRSELVLPADATANVTAYIGRSDGGRDAKAWEFRLPVGERPSGTIAAPIEELKPATTYYYTFEAKGNWSDTLSFVTKPPVQMQNNRDWLRQAGQHEFPTRGFVSARPAGRWEDALISGNGKMGAMVFGHPLEERIILSHERLFLPWRAPLPPVDTETLLSEIRRLIREGRYQDAADLVVTQSLKENYGPKRWTDPFIPAFDLLVHMPAQGPVRNFARSVDYSTGVATVRWEDDRGEFRRRLFVSRADNVVVLSIKGPAGKPIPCEMELAQRPIGRFANRTWSDDKFANGIRQVEISNAGEWMTYRSSYRNSEGGYQGVAHVKRNAGEVLVILGIEPLEKYIARAAGDLQKEVASVRGSFETLLARHTAIHGAIFNRVKLDLGGGEDRLLPSEDLIAKSTVDRTSMALLEKVFDSGRYTILSSSGELPPNLQGKWTGTWDSPWSGDYTLNGNLQTAIASLFNGNMPECADGLFRYIDSLVPAFRVNAQRMYGARGILIPTRTSTHGFNNHFDKTWPVTFWTAGAGWLAHFYYDYYLYTGDERFLRDRALPFMKGAAEFYEDFLVEGPNGKYEFDPSYSPENHPANEKSQASINATMDIAVAQELLTNLIDACHRLKTEATSVERWKRMLAKMPAYEVNADGALKEWTWAGLHDNYLHRHASHLYMLFYGIPDDIVVNPDLLKACRRAIELRMNERVKQDGGEMAFGIVQLGQAAVSMGEGETVYTMLRWLANRYYYSNLVSSHNPGPSIFNVDISGGLPDLVIRMLVQSKPGRIDLLPALPAALSSGSISGVLAHGQVLVKSLEWQPAGLVAVLHSPKGQTVQVSARGTTRAVRLASGKDTRLEFELENRR
jgi:hypothetical protein